MAKSTGSHDRSALLLCSHCNLPDNLRVGTAFYPFLKIPYSPFRKVSNLARKVKNYRIESAYWQVITGRCVIAPTNCAKIANARFKRQIVC
jgi:hypothetical protein